MGVHGLWRLLESSGKPVNPETLEGKILAVDISIWLNQAVKGVRDREGNSVQNAHLLTLFHRICKLLFFRIRPVFVFDGDAPLLKKQTLALRRQRKEELTQESKQTNEKLLKTFLKRQAIKAALGDKSVDPLPSLTTTRRNEVDDMYVLPALPPAEEEEKSSSEAEEEEESHDADDSFYMYEGEQVYANPNSMDINSEDFASLPPEMKYEILQDMKEFCKRRRSMIQKPPEVAEDFSRYQLAGLLQRNKLNQRLENVEKEMKQQNAGSAPQLHPDGEQQTDNIETHRLVSEDNSHYILIKGSKNGKNPDQQPSVSSLSRSSIPDYRRRKVDRPEPLWRPVYEEDEDLQDSSSEDSKPSQSKPTISSQDTTSPLSPRTLKAIQSAMWDSSDDEKLLEPAGSVSPRTLQAIQRALTEEQEEKERTTEQKIISQPEVVISSSDEELESKALKKSPPASKEEYYIPLKQQDVLFSNLAEEMEDIIGQRNKAFRSAITQQVNTREESKVNGAIVRPEQKSPEVTMVKSLNVLTEDGAPETCSEKPKVPLDSAVSDLIPNIDDKERDVVDEKAQSNEESESEESFIEVSEEDEDEEDKNAVKDEQDVSAVEVSEETLNVSEEEENKHEGEKDHGDEMAAESSSAPEMEKWDQLDLEELQSLENSLQAEQSSLREQKQQQERMANTVTGQMYLESQELLSLFGVPYLVAPTEAEAQCAALDRADQTNGTITDDSDVWLFGGRHVYRNFFSHNKYVEHYQYSDLKNQLGLDRTKLINLAYLLGSDYTEGVQGVGYVTGMEILNEFPGSGLEPLVQFSTWWSEAQEKKRLVADPRDTKVKRKLRDLKLQPGFPNPAVAQAYLDPTVDQSDSSFSWGRPQLDMIKEFCQSRFGWSSRKTEETLQPVMKQMNLQQTQLRIDSFFRLEQQEKQAIKSQRLRRAITCMKRKETGREEEDTEDDKASPSKCKKGHVVDETKGMGQERSVGVGGGFLGSVNGNVLAPSQSVCGSRDLSSGSPVAQSTESKPTRRSSSGSSSGSSSSQESPVKPAQSAKTKPTRARRSSSSDSDDGSDANAKVAMVTARSVFEGNRRGRAGKSIRGRGRKKADLSLKLKHKLL
ncbi:DNA excision repair protein ERCC-5 homolog [Synchiropus splendidus]|uniref:DNA excision repair protein ERCC-5 homolog n=1 Tax=Synchiropus splendidus TaxID=270530 RepID=UPI00237D7E20|nr:DNA excision repair protein ERCC-5 homolog [Synchiropus splendidus]